MRKYPDPIEIKCKKCGNIRFVKTHGVLLTTYLNKNPLCRLCATEKVRDKISKGWFKKGKSPWNKGKKGAQKSFRKGKSNGYINTFGYKVYYRNGIEILEHREVMEKYLGRKLGIKEIIHHIDTNKQNNNINNLQLTDRS